ncbi:MAG: hypothetical protein NWF12_00190, partial [Candidatus Bathyarchaeota archaeon]|nr:hypothetical protein [Candidatus Bathyarchaeota archaeon]
LLIFTVLPLYAPSQIPPEFTELLAEAGISLTGFLNQIAMIGVVIAALTLAKGFVEVSSPVYLLASIGSSVVMLAFTVITLSFGDLGNLGVTTVAMDIEGAVNTAVVDLRFFLQLATLSVGLQIIHSFLEFTEARKEMGPAAPEHPL